jgi:hypothetical protein
LALAGLVQKRYQGREVRLRVAAKAGEILAFLDRLA